MKLALPSPQKLTLSLLTALVSLASAQESIPLPEAQKAARKLVSAAGASNALPLAVDADVEHPAGLKGGEAGVMVLPDKSLTTAVITSAGEKFAPVGQLWSLKATVTAGSGGFASDKLRVVNINDGERTRRVQFFLLGVARNAQGELELGVFGQGAEPLYRVALQKQQLIKQDFPIELTGHKTGDASARLNVRIFGEYTADIDLIAAE